MISVLDDHLVNQIAAGEVVERPASVVKELVENALDAGARRVDIRLRSGGTELVRIADDGCGMSRDDALLCVERHATSKIRTDSDLFAIHTLGFRGEALPSIASVSRFELVTRRAEDEVGTRLRIEHGHRIEVSDVGCAPGTVVEVASLFENLPARRKFLRSEPTELGHCAEVVVREALARPDVDFMMTHGEREVLRAPASRTRDGRARALLGDAARTMLAVALVDEDVQVEGLVGPAAVHRADPGGMYLYVNGRFVRDAVVRRGVQEAFRAQLPRGRHPVVVLDVRVDPAAVDVNVHPAKTEVRFRDPIRVARVVQQAVEAALATSPPPLVQPSQGRARADGWTSTVPAHPDDDPRLGGAPVGAAQPPIRGEEPEIADAPGRCEWTPPRGNEPTTDWLCADPVDRRFRDVRIIGALADAFVLCDDDGDLVLIDAAAARRELWTARVRALGKAEARRLTTPRVVAISAQRSQLFDVHDDELRALGLEIEVFGPTEVAVCTVPVGVPDDAIPAMVRDVADALGEHDDVRPAIARHLRHETALGPLEMRALLVALDELPASSRPFALRASAGELRRRLRRG